MRHLDDRSNYLSQKLAIGWYQCWQDLTIDIHTVERVFQELINAYTQPDRYYHNLTHIDNILSTISRFSNMLNDPLAIYLAGWFHDFVYDSQASDNEDRSMQAAQKLLRSIGLDRAIVDRISGLILATQGHQIDPHDLDRCILLDADLAILGTDPVLYQMYQRSIRREYSWVTDNDYRTGRIRVLESFLSRKRLYYTDLLFNELESIARINVATEILQLNANI
jgi:predicted metal-dependent HD superfamily phosphohydrolase